MGWKVYNIFCEAKQMVYHAIWAVDMLDFSSVYMIKTNEY